MNKNEEDPIVLISNAMLEYYVVHPRCVPIEDSGIQLEWRNTSRKKGYFEARELEIEIVADGYFYIYFSTDNKKPESGIIKEGDKNLVDKLFKWLNFEIDKI